MRAHPAIDSYLSYFLRSFYNEVNSPKDTKLYSKEDLVSVATTSVRSFETVEELMKIKLQNSGFSVEATEDVLEVDSN